MSVLRNSSCQLPGLSGRLVEGYHSINARGAGMTVAQNARKGWTHRESRNSLQKFGAQPPHSRGVSKFDPLPRMPASAQRKP